MRGIAIYLACCSFLLAANTSAQQNGKTGRPIGEWEPGGHKQECTEGNQAPNCIPRPHVISSTPPTYSEEARKAKLEGSVILGLVVDESGKPTNVRVISSLGMGLDEKAIEALKSWKFAPAFGQDGKPVAAEIAAEVAFHL